MIDVCREIGVLERVPVNVHTYSLITTHTRTYVYVYMKIYMYTYIHTCPCIHTHTHVHIYRQYTFECVHITNTPAHTQKRGVASRALFDARRLQVVYIFRALLSVFRALLSVFRALLRGLKGAIRRSQASGGVYIQGSFECF